MTGRHIPPEILDYIVDFLQDDPETLKQCCLISKSWVPRTRKYLFAVVSFYNPDDIEAWEKAFPDPSNSPAHHTHTLFISYFKAVGTTESAKYGWIQDFSRVVRFEVEGSIDGDLGICLAPFYNTLKSLRVSSHSIPHSQVVDLMYHLPLLEDVTLFGFESKLDKPQIIGPPSTSAALTGTLELRLMWGIPRTIRRLLGLPNGLHFRKLTLFSHGAEGCSVGKLVDACSDSLEYLDVGLGMGDEPTPSLIDLSNATKLKDVELRCNFLGNKWVAISLETAAKLQHLQRTSIHIASVLASVPLPNGNTVQMEEERAHALRSDLDPLLVQFWESHSIRTKISYPSQVSYRGSREMAGWSDYQLPESTKRGIIDLVEVESKHDS